MRRQPLNSSSLSPSGWPPDGAHPTSTSPPLPPLRCLQSDTLAGADHLMKAQISRRVTMIYGDETQAPASRRLNDRGRPRSPAIDTGRRRRPVAPWDAKAAAASRGEDKDAAAEQPPAVAPSPARSLPHIGPIITGAGMLMYQVARLARVPADSFLAAAASVCPPSACTVHSFPGPP
jgi:hypothetical protein